jgi:DNA-directed RNA polymerase subunit RPC12/RpoP
MSISFLYLNILYWFMCSVGGPMEISYEERAKGIDYKCNSCGEHFKGIGKKPMCPNCQSTDVVKR